MSNARAEREAGFSVVEALVALAVFALAGVGLIQLQAHSVQTLTRAERAALAGIAAQNTLIEAITARDKAPIGESVGAVDIAGRTWLWRMRVAATADANTRRVTVIVADGEGAAPIAQADGFYVVATSGAAP
ncbi:MAG: type II secretion system protein GspI [Alphaproteobacteria bacterium]|nr:type II secretion system protein GspI [Alphaproteobacteria bacterium]